MNHRQRDLSNLALAGVTGSGGHSISQIRQTRTPSSFFDIISGGFGELPPAAGDGEGRRQRGRNGCWPVRIS